MAFWQAWTVLESASAIHCRLILLPSGTPTRNALKRADEFRVQAMPDSQTIGLPMLAAHVAAPDRESRGGMHTHTMLKVLEWPSAADSLAYNLYKGHA